MTLLGGGAAVVPPLGPKVFGVAVCKPKGTASQPFRDLRTGRNCTQKSAFEKGRMHCAAAAAHISSA